MQFLKEKEFCQERLTNKLFAILLMQSKMCLCYNGGTVGNLKTFIEFSDSILEHIPLTESLLSSL